MKTIGIMGALPEEVARIMAGLTETRVESCAGVDFHLGRRAGKKLVVCSGGVGKVNAAATAQVLITRFGAEALIFSGIAGSTSPDAGMGDVVIGKELCYHDAEDKLLKLSAPWTALYSAHPMLVDAMEQACALTGVHCVVGRIATGDRVVADAEEKQRIIKKCHPACVEMEGAAMAQVAMRCGVPFVVVRVISDECLPLPRGEKLDMGAYVTTAAAVVVAAVDALKGLDAATEL